MTAAGGRTDRYSRSPAGSTVVQASAFDLAYVTGTEDAPTRGRYAVVYDFRVGEHARREFVPLAEPAGLYRHVAAGGANWWSRAYEVTGPAGRTNEGDVCDPDRREVGDGTGTETRIVVAHGLRCVTTRSTLEEALANLLLAAFERLDGPPSNTAAWAVHEELTRTADGK